MGAVEGEALPGYKDWLPDRTVTLYRDPALWAAERQSAFSNIPAHQQFWSLLDKIAAVFWKVSRSGITLPIQSLSDLFHAACAIGVRHIPLARYLNWTLGDALRHFGLRDDVPLVGLLSILVEDTVHSSVDAAPLINAALGITIRGAGLTRPQGGMRGFWKRFRAHYEEMGGELRVGCAVDYIDGVYGDFHIATRRGSVHARTVISALPVALTAQLGPPAVQKALRPYIERDAAATGGATVVFLGVPEEEVSGQDFTHHQLLESYSAPLGNGNNLFISVSAPGDTESAPAGYRSVMISTHCGLDEWETLSPAQYQEQKAAAGNRLIALARRVYPCLAENPVVCHVATPRTYERFTGRPRRSVGGIRQTIGNSNQHAVLHDLGVPGFWVAGDTTWPGLGTVACVLGSRIIARQVAAAIPTPNPHHTPHFFRGLA